MSCVKKINTGRTLPFTLIAVGTSFVIYGVSASTALAQGTSTRLEEINIDADESGASESIGRSSGGLVGTSTTVITREQIERSPHTNIADIIAREAGVQTTNNVGGIGGVGTQVDLRGFGITSSSNTLVLINGRRLNDWDLQGFDYSKISKQSVERIEISRGNSGAVLYGDGAVGGVINIVTRTGGRADGNELSIDGTVGSFGYREGNISASGSSGAFSYFVNGNGIHSDGYRDNNALNQRSVTGDLRYEFNKGSVYFSFAADDQTVGFPGDRKVNPGQGINELVTDRRGTGTPLDNGASEVARATVGFKYFVAPKVELILDGGIRDKKQIASFFSAFGSAFDSYLDTDLTTLSFTPRVKVTQPILGLPSRIIAGVDVYDVDYESDRALRDGQRPFRVYTGEDKTLAGYLQHSLKILPMTDVTAGGRVQRTKTTANDALDTTAPGGAFNTQGDPLDESRTNHAWNVGFEHTFVPGVAVFGRIAESFRIANIDERIGSALFGVPTTFTLETQTSEDWEAGARFSSGPFEVQSSYYDMRLTNEIQFDPVNFINRNLDPTRRRGVETIARWQITPQVRLGGNITYTDARFREGPLQGNRVPLVSLWTGNASLSWDIYKDWLTLDTIVSYVGDRRMDNDQENFQPKIEERTTVDLRLGGQVEQFYWSASVVNLFDEEYFDYSVASANTARQGVFNAYPQPGRTFTAKVGTKW